MESCLVISIVGVIMMCIFEYVAWSQLVVKYVLLRSSHPCHDLTRVMRRTHFSKLSSYSSKNRKLVRGMSGLTVRPWDWINLLLLRLLVVTIVLSYCCCVLFIAWVKYLRQVFIFLLMLLFSSHERYQLLKRVFTDNRSQHSSFFRNNARQTWNLFFFLFFSFGCCCRCFFSLWRSKMQQQKKPFYIDSSAFCC